MLILVQRAGPQLELGDIEKLAKRLGLAFPAGFQRFLLEYNGGEPIPEGFTFYDGPEPHQHAVQEFLGIGRQRESANIEWTFELIADSVSRKFCPFGNTPTGEILCIGVSEEYWNTVRLYDYHPSPPVLYRVQDTFEQFLDELHCREDPNETRYEHVARNFSAREVADLLAAGENLDTPDAFGRTLIEWAAICNRPDIIKFLVAKGFPLRSALHYAEVNLEFWPEYAGLVEYLRGQSSKGRPNT